MMTRSRFCRVLVFGAAAVTLLASGIPAGAPPASGPAAQAAPCSSRDPMKCKVCRPPYEKAAAYVCDKVKQSTFPVKMVAGWLFLTDERFGSELKHCVDCAVNWKKQRGWREQSHPENWYPALAAVFLAEYYKYVPEPRVLEAMNDLVKWFTHSQEPKNNGWWKWKEGAYKDRLDYSVVNHGYLTSLVMSFFYTARAHGVTIPEPLFRSGDEALLKITTARGIGYGLPRKGGSGWGDKTGARGAWVIQGLAYSGQLKHKVWEVYEKLLVTLIPKMDQGHHVGAFHGLALILGCHIQGPLAYKKLTDHWLHKLIAKQGPGGDLYIGDDGEAGGEPGLLRGNVGSTAAFALMIRLQDPRCLVPKTRARRGDGVLVMRVRKTKPRETRTFDFGKRRAAEAEAKKRRQVATKSIQEEAARVWDGRLLTRAREALKAKEEISFTCGVLGGSATVAGVDGKGNLQVAGRDGAVWIAPGRLPMNDRMALALALLREGEPADHCLAAFYCLAAGKKEKGEALLEKGGKGADAVRAFFKSLGL